MLLSIAIDQCNYSSRLLSYYVFFLRSSIHFMCETILWPIFVHSYSYCKLKLISFHWSNAIILFHIAGETVTNRFSIHTYFIVNASNYQKHKHESREWFGIFIGSNLAILMGLKMDFIHMKMRFVIVCH